ncbi:MAG: PspC domain-containing protein [Candidatus Ancillula sp.]|jgi:phage shock protein PspC (stress-responsive transcriptional regulator)/cation transport ATPase|nr:PspC domain-containing protein [Candidatus Ancillula sp.]
MENENENSFFNWIYNTGIKRSSDKLIAGVSGGLALRYGWKRGLVRLVLICLLFLGIGLFLYGALAILLPSEENPRIPLAVTIYGGELNGDLIVGGLIIIFGLLSNFGVFGSNFWGDGLIAVFITLVIAIFLFFVITNNKGQSAKSQFQEHFAETTDTEQTAQTTANKNTKPAAIIQENLVKTTDSVQESVNSSLAYANEKVQSAQKVAEQRAQQKINNKNEKWQKKAEYKMMHKWMSRQISFLELGLCLISGAVLYLGKMSGIVSVSDSFPLYSGFILIWTLIFGVTTLVAGIKGRKIHGWQGLILIFAIMFSLAIAGGFSSGLNVNFGDRTEKPIVMFN